MKKARNECCGLLLMVVRLAGIEPTTPWFVAKYSIQLSYSRTDSDYSTGKSADLFGRKFLECSVVGRDGLEPSTNGL